MRIFAGSAIQADILCEGRLILGVGRGAFAYEMARMGKPIEELRERFDELLDVLMALFTREEVSWQGKYYNFEPITVMPRPVTKPMPHIMMAALIPEAIEASAKRGFHIQTTPLNATVEKMTEQVERLQARQGVVGRGRGSICASLCRGCAAWRSPMPMPRPSWNSPMIITGGSTMCSPAPASSRTALSGICRSSRRWKSSSKISSSARPPKWSTGLALYHELGVDDLIMNVNIGHSNDEALECMERFGADVLPLFVPKKKVA